MSISAVGSTAGSNATQMASSLVSSLDSSEDGSIDKNEFVKGMTSIGISSDEASTTFDSLDTAKTGKLTQTTLESALSGNSSSTTTTISSAAVEKLASESSSSTEPSSTSATSAATTSSTSEIYDKEDANEDGEVTTQEEMTYDRKHPETVTDDGPRAMPPPFAGRMVDETA